MDIKLVILLQSNIYTGTLLNVRRFEMKPKEQYYTSKQFHAHTGKLPGWTQLQLDNTEIETLLSIMIFKSVQTSRQGSVTKSSENTKMKFSIKFGTSICVNYNLIHLISCSYWEEWSKIWHILGTCEHSRMWHALKSN